MHNHMRIPPSPSSEPLIPDTTYAQSLVSDPPTQPTPTISTTISTLNLQSHPEGGYFVETDRNPTVVSNPYLDDAPLNNPTSIDTTPTRNASTTIFYFLDPRSPTGHFHRNKSRTVHTLHRGRGRYVVLHANDRPDDGGPCRLESFAVGHDLSRGEKMQWIVEGGKFKASFLVPDPGKGESEAGLLISETVVPGFDYADHDFLTLERLREVVAEEQVGEMVWLLKKEERQKWAKGAA